MPAASTGATAASTRSAIIAISVLLRRPPPETTHSLGCSGKCSRARAMLVAVKAVSVAAPSCRREAFDKLQQERVAIERLRRRLAEIGVPQVLHHVVVVHAARRRQRAVLVARHAATAQHPVIDHGIARAGVEGQQRAVASDPGDVGDAADVEHDDGPLRQLGRQRAVIDRRQRRALPAGGAVGRAQVVDHVDADAPRRAPGRRRAAP